MPFFNIIFLKKIQKKKRGKIAPELGRPRVVLEPSSTCLGWPRFGPSTTQFALKLGLGLILVWPNWHGLAPASARPPLAKAVRAAHAAPSRLHTGRVQPSTYCPRRPCPIVVLIFF